MPAQPTKNDQTESWQMQPNYNTKIDRYVIILILTGNLFSRSQLDTPEENRFLSRSLLASKPLFLYLLPPILEGIVVLFPFPSIYLWWYRDHLSLRYHKSYYRTRSIFRIKTRLGSQTRDALLTKYLVSNSRLKATVPYRPPYHRIWKLLYRTAYHIIYHTIPYYLQYRIQYSVCYHHRYIYYY